MDRQSAGILIYRHRQSLCEVLLAHPGGPFWRRKWTGAWQIPKGLVEKDETPTATARREVAEELGIILDHDPIPLATIRQAGGKVVDAFLLEHDFDPAILSSNTVTLEWPRGSGRLVTFPEIDEVRWFSLDEAEQAILTSQSPLIAALRLRLTGKIC